VQENFDQEKNIPENRNKNTKLVFFSKLWAILELSELITTTKQ
jgi:hypothetical protein